MSQQLQSAFLNAETEYRINYPTKSARITAVQAAFLTSQTAATAADGKDLTSTGADGTNATWAINLSATDKASVLRMLLNKLEGRERSAFQIYTREARAWENS